MNLNKTRNFFKFMIKPSFENVLIELIRVFEKAELLALEFLHKGETLARDIYILILKLVGV